MEAPLILSREQVRRVDAIAIERYGVSGLVLMENAGRGVVDVLLSADREPGPVLILCGKGNNGGDGFVIARQLAIRGVEAKVALLCSPEELSADARVNYELLAPCGIEVEEISHHGSNLGAVGASLIPPLTPPFEGGGSLWIVDAMLGTGATGEPREPVASAIRWMNAQRARRLAVDVPSGLDCDTGKAASATVRADVTCTFVGMKRGFLEPRAQQYLGQVHVVSIGLPAGMVERALGD